MLERVQKLATKILSQHRHLSYTDRLKVYKLPTLHYRQIRGDMIGVYKIITGKYEGAVAPRLERDDIAVTRGNELKLVCHQLVSGSLSISKYFRHCNQHIERTTPLKRRY